MVPILAIIILNLDLINTNTQSTLKKGPFRYRSSKSIKIGENALKRLNFKEMMFLWGYERSMLSILMKLV